MIGLGLLRELNAATREERLLALERAVKAADFPPVDPRIVNNHIHTTYSFSPYSPSAAVYAARAEGLATCGIVDHDSMGGAEEFIEAGKIAGIPTTIGVETRVSFADTPFSERRTNNPDQTGSGYMVLHAVPHGMIDRVQAYFAPLREKRNARNKNMIERINKLYAADGVQLDFERDVLPLSQYENGGSVTERHLMLVLARQLLALGKASLPEGAGELDVLLAEYDLVGALKKDCIPKVFVPATDESPALDEFVRFSEEVGGVLAYAYLGDVTASVTGDKKAQAFEDGCLDELFEFLHGAGIRAVTYMPTRNTQSQLDRLRALCEKFGMLQISGEDINSPRQRFTIDKMREEQFSNLIDSTWSLIRRENGETAQIITSMRPGGTRRTAAGKGAKETMKTKAVRLYGANDIRLEEFELSPVGDDGVRCKVVSDSLCMSTYKALTQGAAHKRVPSDVAEHPTIVGHEFCGVIDEVGRNWAHKFKKGDGFVIQPAHSYKGSLLAPGYSYTECGGDATFVNIPWETLHMDCLLPYNSDVFFYGSLAEPMSCIIATFHAMYHTRDGEYVHDMGIVEGGRMALLAGVGPMGLGAIDYALHCDRKPSLLVVTDIDDARLARAESIYSVAHAKECGVELHYVNTGKVENPAAALRELSGKTGFDDVICFAPVKPVVEQADAILAVDGCLNFFAGPGDTGFSAMVNFYNVHYNRTHVAATSHGNTDDMREAIAMMNAGKLNPAAMITHIGGLDSVVETTKNLPKIPGGKKLIYTQITLPLTAIADFAEKGKTEPLFAELDKIVKSHNGLWNAEAEKYLLEHA